MTKKANTANSGERSNAAKTSVYEMFKMDKDYEKNGIKIDYGEFRITIARAGGSNLRFRRVSEIKTKSLRRAIQTETLDVERAEAVLREIYAEAVILNWEICNEDGDWQKGIHGLDGSVVPFKKETVVEILKELPELFQDLQEQATKLSLFREANLEDEGKN